MEVHLKIVGCILIVLALIHVDFPRRFNWRKELPLLGLLNRQMMYVHTFFLALMMLLLGCLCFFASVEIVNTKLGHQLSFGLTLFWGVRLFFQFFVYSPELWKGKKFERAVHLVFISLWSYLTVVFFLISYPISQ